MRVVLVAVCLGVVLIRAAAAMSSALGQTAAAYLTLPASARSLAMGQASSAVPPRDAAIMQANPAALVLMARPSFSATSAALGVDRLLMCLADLPDIRSVRAFA